MYRPSRRLFQRGGDYNEAYLSSIQVRPQTLEDPNAYRYIGTFTAQLQPTPNPSPQTGFLGCQFSATPQTWANCSRLIVPLSGTMSRDITDGVLNTTPIRFALQSLNTADTLRFSVGASALTLTRSVKFTLWNISWASNWQADDFNLLLASYGFGANAKWMNFTYNGQQFRLQFTASVNPGTRGVIIQRGTTTITTTTDTFFPTQQTNGTYIPIEVSVLNYTEITSQATPTHATLQPTVELTGSSLTFGSQYTMYWYNPNSRTDYLQILMANPTIGPQISSLTNYLQNYSTFIQANSTLQGKYVADINLSSLYSSFWQQDIETKYGFVGISTANYSTSTQTLSTARSIYSSTLSQYFSTLSTLSSFSSMVSISTPLLSTQYATLYPIQQSMLLDYTVSTIDFTTTLSTLYSYSTSIELIEVIRDTFRRQGGRAVSTLSLMYPNLSAILQSQTGDPSLYQRGGGVLAAYETTSPWFQAGSISSLIQYMTDEQTALRLISTTSTVFLSASQQRDQRISTLSPIQISTAAMYTRHVSANQNASIWDIYYLSSKLQADAADIPYIYNTKRSTLNVLESRQVAILSTLEWYDTRITMAKTAEDMIRNGVDATSLYMDIDPNTFNPDTNMMVSASFTLWSISWASNSQADDFNALLAKYGFGANARWMNFMYNGQQFRLQFTANTNLGTRGVIIQQGTTTLTTATNRFFPTQQTTGKYTPIRVSILNPVLRFQRADTVYTDMDYSHFVNKIGIYNDLIFSANNNTYSLRFLDTRPTISTNTVDLRFWNGTTRQFVPPLQANLPPPLSFTSSSASLDFVPSTFTTRLRFQSLSTGSGILNRSDYYSMVRQMFGLDTWCYFNYNLYQYRLQFPSPELSTATAHPVALQVDLNNDNIFYPLNPAVPQQVLPTGAPFPIQITIRPPTLDDVLLLQTTLNTLRSPVYDESISLQDSITKLMADIQDTSATLAETTRATWNAILQSTITVESQKYTDLDTIQDTLSSLRSSLEIVSRQFIPSSFISTATASTMNSVRAANQRLLDTYSQRISTFYSLESRLQVVMAQMEAVQANTTISQDMCSELTKEWTNTFQEYSNLSTQRSGVVVVLSTLSADYGRPFINPGPIQLPPVANFSSCAIPNRLSSLNYQIGGDYLSKVYEFASTTFSTNATLNQIVEDLRLLGAAPSDTSQGNGFDLQMIRQKLMLEFYKVLSTYNSYLGDANTYEFTLYENAIQEISSAVLYEISERRADLVSNSNNSTITIPANVALSALRPFRGTVERMMAVVSEEKQLRSMYCDLKKTYENELWLAKYENKSGNPQSFIDLKTSLDQMVSIVNTHIPYRQSLFSQFRTELDALITQTHLKQTTIGEMTGQTLVTDVNLSTTLLYPRIPAQMAFLQVEQRNDYFIPGGLIPYPMPACRDAPDPTLAAPITRQSRVEPTTTVGAACGVLCSMVSITNPGINQFEVTQIEVIDRTGKNIAFNRPVSFFTSGTQFQQTTLPTNGISYSTELQTRLGTNIQVFSGQGLELQIPLEAATEVTAVRYSRASGSSFDTRNLQVTLWNGTEQTATKQSYMTADEVVFDFRSELSSRCPVERIDRREGVCGLMARYVRVYPPDVFPPLFQFQLSQIAVVGTGGQNVAKQRPCRLYGLPSTVNAPMLTDGTLQSRVAAFSFQSDASATSYLEVDLGTEQDVVAVHLHSMIANETASSFLDGMRCAIYTHDMVFVAENRTFGLNTRKHVIPFQQPGTDRDCSTKIQWPAYYGKAGIIASQIRITQPAATGLAFGTVKVIDKTGTNVVAFKDVVAAPGTTILGRSEAAVQDAARPSDIAVPFRTTATANSSITIPFGEQKEICAVILMVPIGTGFSANTLIGIQIQLGDSEIFTVSSVPANTVVILDTRYDPDDEGFKYPITETNPILRNGQFGLYTQQLQIRPIPSRQGLWTNFVVTEGTGKDLQTIAGSTTKTLSIVFQDITNMIRVGDYFYLLERFGEGRSFTFTANSVLYTCRFQTGGASGNVHAITLSPVPTFTIATLPATPTYEQLRDASLSITIDCSKLTYSYVNFANTFTAHTLEFASAMLVRPTYSATSFFLLNLNVYHYFRYNSNTFRIVFTNFSDTVATPPPNRHVSLEIDADKRGSWSRIVAPDTRIPTDGTPIPIEVFTPDTMNLYFPRVYEVNAVLVEGFPFQSTDSKVRFMDCGDKTMADVFTSHDNKVNYKNTEYFLVDVRKRKDATERAGPTTPFSVRYGPKNTGVLTRYIEIISPDETKPLYLSQIVAINACGRNVARERDTYQFNTNVRNSALAVDGVYENELSPNLGIQDSIYAAYKQKPEAQSYVSGTGAGVKWAVDLGPFIQTGTDCDSQYTSYHTDLPTPNSLCAQRTDGAYCYEHEITSVIVVAPTGRNLDMSGGVIIRLLDGDYQQVGIYKTSNIIIAYGVDFADFRRDTSNDLARFYIEAEQRSTRTEGLGLMTQFVRVEQVPDQQNPEPIQMSQLFVLDTNGINVALYKPTKAFSSGFGAQPTTSYGQDMSYLAVDGRYYMRSPISSATDTLTGNEGYISMAGPGQYLEVNLGREYPVAKVFLYNLITGTTPNAIQQDAQRLGSMRIKLYNKYKDCIAVQTLTSSQTGGTTGMLSMTVGNPNETRTIQVCGVNIAAKVMTKKYENNFIPVLPENAQQQIQVSPTADPVNFVNADTNIQLQLTPRFTRVAPNYGIGARFVRVLNPNNYIQISQLMVFDRNGINQALQVPTTNVIATNALPGRYPEYAVDGAGGFFHTPRDEPNCFISEKKPYEFWMLRLSDTASVEIIGMKYVAPKTGRTRNKGLRFQLLDDSMNVLSEYVLTNDMISYPEVWIDFRLPGMNLLPIQYICFPRLETAITGLNYPIGLAEGPNGTVYVTTADGIRRIPYSANVFGTPVVEMGTTFSGLMGLTYNAAAGAIYVVDGSKGVTQCPVNSGTGALSLGMSLNAASNTYYTVCVDPVSSRIYASNYATPGSIAVLSQALALQTPLVLHSGATYITGMAIRTNRGKRYLYYASGYRVYAYDLTSTPNAVDLSQTIGGTGTPGESITVQFSQPRDQIQFQGPVGLAADGDNNLYIVDTVANTVYICPPDPDTNTIGLVYQLAGNGTAGLSDYDPTLSRPQPATTCMLDTPVFCLYHTSSGDLLITDARNGRIRRVRIARNPRATQFTDKTRAPAYSTTTVAKESDPSLQTVVAFTKKERRDRETLREYKAPPRIFLV